MFDMTRLKRSSIALGAAAITALGVGGIAVAQNGGQAQTPAPQVKPAQVKQAAEPKGPDRDNIRSGDQATPDEKGSTSEAPGTEAKEAPGAEAKEAPGAEGNEAPGQETKQDSDGPGGHADEPGNPNADHQFQGKE